MKRIEFYIGTQLADTLPDFNLQLILSVQSIDGTTSGAYGRRSVKLPYTKKNAEIFRQVAAPMQVADNQYHLLSVPCYITANGITVFKGMAQLSGLELAGKSSQRQGTVINVDVIGNNTLWIEAAKTQKIRDLVWYDADHTLTDTGVIAGITALDADIDNYGYTLIKYREWANASYVLVDEFTTFLYVKKMLEKFFDLFGYNIIGNFFTTEFARRLIMPVPINPDTAEYSARHIMKASLPTTQTILIGAPGPNTIIDFTNGITADPSGHFNATQFGYALNDIGTFTVTLKVTVTNTLNNTTAGTIALTMHVGTTVPYTLISFYPDVTTVFPPSDPATYYATFTIPITYAELGAYLIPYIRFDGDYITDADILAEIEIIYIKTYGYGSSIQFAEIIPKSWLIADLIKGLSECFNLVFDTDTEAQTVLIQCGDDWYETQKLPTPLKTFREGYYGTSQIDRSLDRNFAKSAEIKFEQPFRWYGQKYQDQDPTVEALNATTVPKIYENITHLNEVGVGTQTVENAFFATTIHNPEPAIISPTSLVTPIVPMAYGVNHLVETTTDGSYDESPRLLYWGGQDESYGRINVDFSGVITDTLLPISFVFNTGDVSGGFDPCLSYSDQQLSNGNIAQGLSSVFYPKEIARISQFFTLTEFILLSIVDIVNFKFSQLWYLDGTKYIPTKIEYNPSGGEAKVTLRADADLPMPANQIQNLRIGGMAFGSAAALQAYLISKGHPTATVQNYTDNGFGYETFAVGGFNSFAAQTFENETNLTSFEDLTGWVSYLGAACFNACLNLAIFVANNVSGMANAVFIQTALTEISLPNCAGMSLGVFASCPNLATINLPVCTDLGGTVFDDSVFDTINGGAAVTLTVPTALSIADAGNPDGDIQYLLATNAGSVINYI